MFLKVDANLKQLIDEISALSGLQKDVIREVWEFTAIQWAESLLQANGGSTHLSIPHMGSVMIKYIGDEVLESGEVTTNVNAIMALSPSFKKLVGDLVDERENILEIILEKKINSAILTSSDDED